MEKMLTNTPAFRCKTPVAVLSLAALGVYILYCISCCFSYSYIGATLGGYTLVFRLPTLLETFPLLIALASYILLVLCVFRLNRKPYAPVLYTVIYACIILSGAWNLGNYIYVNVVMIKQPLLSYYILRELVFALICLALFAVALLGTLKGFSNKALVIVPFVFIFLFDLYSVTSSVLNIITNYHTTTLYYFRPLMEHIAESLSHIALFLFALLNKLPPLLRGKEADRITRNLPPEQALALLQEKLELGILTEEEYQRQRAEIIARL